MTGAPTNSILRIPPKQTRFAVRVETTLKLASCKVMTNLSLSARLAECG